jgi:hypothetical protein
MSSLCSMSSWPEHRSWASQIVVREALYRRRLPIRHSVADWPIANEKTGIHEVAIFYRHCGAAFPPAEVVCSSERPCGFILLCGKCASELDGGYGPKKDDTVRSTLRRGLKNAGQHCNVRIIGTRCMGICPKKAVIAINASRPATSFVVPIGTPAEDVCTY